MQKNLTQRGVAATKAEKERTKTTQRRRGFAEKRKKWSVVEFDGWK
jgi:hypothetical protein